MNNEKLRKIGKEKVAAILTLQPDTVVSMYRMTPSEVTEVLSPKNWKYQEHGRIRRWAFGANTATIEQKECEKLRKAILKNWTKFWAYSLGVEEKKNQLINILFPPETPQESNCQRFLGVSSSRMRQMRAQPELLKKKHLIQSKSELESILSLINELLDSE